MKNLKNDIKNNNYKNSYIFYGNENYIKKIYTDILLDKLLDNSFKDMNLEVYEGNNADVSNVFDTLETLPFMTSKRVLIIKNKDIFNKKNKVFCDKLGEYIKNINSSSVLIIIEDEVDKRTKLFKNISKYGYCAYFDYLNETDLINFIIKEFKKNNKIISNKEAIHLIRIKGQDISNIQNEIQKLSSYKKEENITISDIDEICIPNLEIKIFALLKSIGNKKINESLNMYANLIFNNEHPLKILVMITRQIRIILGVKVLQNNSYSVDSIASKLKLQKFIVNDTLKQAINYNIRELVWALEECLKTEVSIKKGDIDPNLGVEILIINLSKKN